MRSRQRGAAWLLALLLAGRLLDRANLPFENRRREPAARAGEPRATPLPGTAADSVDDGAAPISAGGRRAAGDSTPAHPARATLPVTPVPINRAGAAELQRLPGVGPVLAGRILAHRDAHGAFRNLADLRAVRGIGPRTCERLAPLVRFD